MTDFHSLRTRAQIIGALRMIAMVRRSRAALIHRNAGQPRYRIYCASNHKAKSMTNWPQQTTDLSTLLRSLRGTAPDVMKAFAGIAKAATVSKALDAKTKELIALGIAVAVRCDDCIAFHVKACGGTGRHEGGSQRDARNGDLYGRRPIGDVCEPRARSVHAIRSRHGETVGQTKLQFAMRKKSVSNDEVSA